MNLRGIVIRVIVEEINEGKRKSCRGRTVTAKLVKQSFQAEPETILSCHHLFQQSYLVHVF